MEVDAGTAWEHCPAGGMDSGKEIDTVNLMT